jgi:PAS domain S-box-containing protein
MMPPKNRFQASVFLEELLVGIVLILLVWIFKPLEAFPNAVVSLTLFVLVLLLRRWLVQKRNPSVSQNLQSLNFEGLELPDRIIVLDKDARYHYVLGNVRHPDAYPSSSILGMSIDEVFADRKDFVDFCHRTIDEVLSSNEAKLIEYTHLFKGGVYPIEAHIAPFTDKHSGKRMVIWISRDIHQRKQMEASLLESEKRLRAFVQVLPDRVIVMDAEGVYQDVLRSNEDSLPIMIETGTNVYERFEKGFADFVIAKVRETLEKQENLVFEYDFIPDNKTYHFEGRTVPYKDPLTGQALVIWMSRDITAQKETRRALEESEKLFRQIFAFLPDRTTVFDKNGTYLDVLHEAVSRVQEGSIVFDVKVGHRVEEYFSEGFTKFCLEAIAKTLDSNQIQVFEYDSPLKDDPQVFEARTIPFINPRSGERNVIWLSREISERRQLETKRLELALQQEKLEFFKQFVDNLTHDLKTPLSVIKTNVYLLKNSPVESQKQKRISNIDAQADLLREMIDDILTLSKLDHFSNLNSHELDLNDLLQELIDDLSSTAEKKAIRLQFSNETEQARVIVSASEMRRAFSNLIDNAITYTPQDGTVTVRLRREDSGYLVSIQDNGIGIDEKDIPHIFDRFFRSEKARFTAAGTGLGLAISRRIIELHYGNIEVVSEVNKGTTFSVLLPAIQPKLESSISP